MSPRKFKTICISLYDEDLEKLDEMVEKLKDEGYRNMSRSMLIRYSLSRFREEHVSETWKLRDFARHELRKRRFRRGRDG